MRVRLLLALLMISIFTSVATAQTAEEIVEKNVVARGGAEKLAAIHSMMVKTLEEANWGGRGSSVLSIIRPDRMRFYYEWRGVGRRAPLSTMIWAFDGETAWAADQRKGLNSPIKMEGNAVEEFREMARGQFIELPSELRASGITVELAGTEPVDGAQCYKIRFLHGDAVRYAYYDPHSFLVVRYEILGHRKSKEVPFRIAVSDYRSVDGILFPHTFKIESVDTSPFAVARGLPVGFAFVGGKKNSTTSTVQSIEINPDMDESSFQIPGNATAKPAKR